jgi:predicted phosphodiesterase
VNDSPTAFLYDIHGNLVALEAVLADVEAAGVTSYLLGGDYSSMGPWPRETADLLEGLPARVRIRGNVERWLREPPEVPESVQEFLATGLTAAREALGPELVDRFYALPEQAELDGILVCHGSPLSDIDSFAPEAQEGEEHLLVGESDRTILFGHSHQQFRRPGPNGTLLVNPGSVGAPLDGGRARPGRSTRMATSPFAERCTTSSGRRPRCARTANGRSRSCTESSMDATRGANRPSLTAQR